MQLFSREDLGFSQSIGPPIMNGGVWEHVGGRERETAYSCILKVLFLVTLKCGKSKSLSLGRLWEEQFKIWERGKLRSPGGIVSLSTEGGFVAIGLLKVRNAYLHEIASLCHSKEQRHSQLICRKRNMQPTPHAALCNVGILDRML